MNELSKQGVQRSDTIVASLAVIIYLALLVLLFLFVKFSVNTKELTKVKASSGVLISFGDDNAGYGDKITKNVDVAKNIPEPKAQPDPVYEPDDVADDALIEASSTQPEQANEPTPEPVTPTINANALYKKTSSTSDVTSTESSSHGATKGADGMTGVKGGSTTEAGGGGDDGFTLEGRKLLSALEKPVYDEQVSGRVEIEIQVDRSGTVTSATVIPQNTNVSSRAVLEAVRQAALKTRFNKSESASFVQVGKIVYILKIE